MTKSQTLSFLEKEGKCFKVLPQITISVQDYLNGSAKYIIENSEICKQKVVVRSSALTEDTNYDSNAGKYLSVLNVYGTDFIFHAIDKVIASMGGYSEKNNEILIQPQLESVQVSGVLFTVDPNTLSKYYVINYDDQTGLTDTVTSGQGQNLKTFYCVDGVKNLYEHWMVALIDAAKEIEDLLNRKSLDIEFAIDGSQQVYIFQARPLIINGEIGNSEELMNALTRIERKINDNNKKKPYLYGERTIYGVMPDWNPAEMIGIRPRPLALSLYKRLITDGTWAYQRNNYGYKNLRSFPLMVDFCGLPYIDTRVSFNSFIPKKIGDDLSNKLVNYYLNQLEKQPEKHDKVEFDIIFSCFTLDLNERIKVLEDEGFTDKEVCEIKSALLELTNNIIDNEMGLWKQDIQKISILEERYVHVLESDLDLADKIYWLLEDCTRYGTLPFAGLARAGFIAIQILNSFISIGILTKTEYEEYIRSLNTISSQITKDLRNLSQKSFVEKYGHLRPGTYDILSSRYDQDIESYFEFQHELNENEKIEDNMFKLSIDQMKLIKDCLIKNELNNDILELFDFLEGAIEGREYSKFVFTKSLSQILELMVCLGESYGFSRDEMSYCNISIINKLYSSSDDPRTIISNSIVEEKEKYRICEQINLPPVITNALQVTSFFVPDTQPNYITQRDITCELVNINGDNEIRGKIVLIKSADPGYDWIFSHDIAGFITAYGGANSHMAIRAGELGLPAVIGVGEKQYNQLLKGKKIRIDCLNKKTYIIK